MENDAKLFPKRLNFFWGFRQVKVLDELHKTLLFTGTFYNFFGAIRGEEKFMNCDVDNMVILPFLDRAVIVVKKAECFMVIIFY